MSFLTNKAFQPNRVSVLIQQQRFRSKINIQKPRAPHRHRQMVETFLTPFINNPDTNKPWRERCKKIPQVFEAKPIRPYDAIIARECLNWFKSSKMVAFFHMNSHSAREQFEFAVALKRSNMYLKGYQQGILELALKGTPYEAALKLIHRGIRVNLFAFGPEPNVDKLVKICKKTPNIILMAGILHGKLLHLNDFVKMGNLDLVSAQAGLVHVLRTSAGGNLNQQLTHHQSTLVTRLKQIGTTEDDPAKTTAGDDQEGEKV